MTGARTETHPCGGRESADTISPVARHRVNQASMWFGTSLDGLDSQFFEPELVMTRTVRNLDDCM